MGLQILPPNPWQSPTSKAYRKYFSFTGSCFPRILPHCPPLLTLSHIKTLESEYSHDAAYRKAVGKKTCNCCHKGGICVINTASTFCACWLCKAGELVLFLTSSSPPKQEETSFTADCCPSQMKANCLRNVVVLTFLSFCTSTYPSISLLNCPLHCALDPCSCTRTPCSEPFIPFWI